MLPTSFVITSLTRSVGVRRARASCSSLAIASMLYWVGFSAARRRNGLSIRLAPISTIIDCWFRSSGYRQYGAVETWAKFGMAGWIERSVDIVSFLKRIAGFLNSLVE